MARPVDNLTMLPIPPGTTTSSLQLQQHGGFAVDFFGSSVEADKDLVSTRADGTFDERADLRLYVYAQKVELGIPLLVRGAYVYLSDPLGWKEYRYEIFGTFATNSPTTALAPHFALLGHNPQEGIVPVRLIAWRRWIFYRDFPVCIRATWHPERGLSTEPLGDLGTIRRSGDVQKLLVDGLKLVQAMDQRGRTRSDPHASLPAIIAAYKRVWHESIRRGEYERPSMEAVAFDLFTYREWIYRQLKPLGLDWASFENRYCSNENFLNDLRDL